MKKLISNVPVLCLVLSVAVGLVELTGCQYRSKDDTYYLVAPNLKLPYWKSVQAGFGQAAKEYGVSMYVVGPDGYDPKAEANDFSQIVARKPAGILVSVADAAALHDDIKTAITSGVPVITVDSDATNSARLFFIGTNNLEVGHLGGKRMVEKLHGKGNIVFYSIPGQPNLEERMKGYHDIIDAVPGIHVVGIVGTGGDSNSAFDQTKQFLSKTGAEKVDAFVCLESASGAAVGEVVKRAGVTDRTIIAMDVNPDTLAMVQDGTIDSTISQKPYTMGYLGLQLLDGAHRAASKSLKTTYATDAQAPFPVFVDTGSSLIDKNNVSLLLSPAQ